MLVAADLPDSWRDWAMEHSPDARSLRADWQQPQRRLCQHGLLARPCGRVAAFGEGRCRFFVASSALTVKEAAALRRSSPTQPSRSTSSRAVQVRSAVTDALKQSRATRARRFIARDSERDSGIGCRFRAARTSSCSHVRARIPSHSNRRNERSCAGGTRHGAIARDAELTCETLRRRRLRAGIFR
jgi:hypothetical protein